MEPAVKLTCSSRQLSIPQMLEDWAARDPQAIAIVAPGRNPLTYGGLLAYVQNTVKSLNAMGVGRNDRVAVVIPDEFEMAIAFLAVAAGASCAPLNPECRANEFDVSFRELNAKALIVPSGADSVAGSVAQALGLPVLELPPVADARADLDDARACPRRSGFAEPGEVALVLATSGTTSRPKIVPLTHANICASARNIGSTLGLSESDRCLNVMPLFHIHGLIAAVLSSLAAGASVVCAPKRSGFRFFECLDEFHPTWYTAVPTIHKLILDMAADNREVIGRRPLRFIRSSSSPLPPHLMGELEHVFQAPVIEAYGMTEAAHQICSNRLPPGKRKAGSVGVAAGPAVAVVDREGNLLPVGKTGEVVIRGPNVMKGYDAADPAVNRSAFIKGWLRTGDEGFLDADSYLFLTGRSKEIINRGGEKISPREVDEVLLQHPAVAQAVAFAIPHPTLGEDIAVALVLRKDASVKDGEIQEFLTGRLVDFKVPRQIVMVDEIPKTASGKVQRNGLAERLGLLSVVKERVVVAPRDPVEIRLTQLWEKILAVHPIGVQDDFFELGGHSLLAMNLLAEITKLWGKNLSLNVFYSARTIEQLANIIRKEEHPGAWSPLVAFQASGSKAPFFWVHGEASNVLLPRYLDRARPIYGFIHQTVDRKRGALYTRVEDIAAYYLTELRRVQPQGPYYLGGWSFGGMIAFEMAQQLRMQFQEVATLVLLDTAAPMDPRRSLSARSDGSNSLASHARFHHRILRHLTNLSRLPALGKLTYLLERLQGKIDENLQNVKNLESQMKYRLFSKTKMIVCRACFALGYPLPWSLRIFYKSQVYAQARLNYAPAIYPGRMIYFTAQENRHDIHLKWGKFAAGGVEVYEVPGNHHSVVKEPYIASWADRLRILLETQEATSPARKR